MPSQPDPVQALLVHQDFVRSLARHLLSDAHAAEDLAQDTWVAALEHGSAALSPRRWLAGVLRKRAVSTHRTAERRGRREREAAREESSPSEEGILAREAVRARVVAAVLALEEPYRESVLLRYFENLPPRAIAARLGCPVETVRTRLKRAHERLRTRLDREHGGREAWGAVLLAWAGPGGDGGPGPTLAAPAALALATAGLGLAAWLSVRALERDPAPAPAEPAAGPVVSAPFPAAGWAAAPAVAARAEVPRDPAPASLQAATGSLRVTVRWSDGAPAAGIRARFTRGTGDSPFFHARRGETDDAGVLVLDELDAGTGWLGLDRNDQSRAEIVAGEETALEITLPRGIDVDGTVVDRAGVPVPEAELWLSDLNSFTGAFVGRAGADGRFALRSCQRGQELGAFAAGHAPSLLTSLGAEEGTHLSVRLVLLGPGGEVRGRVRGPDGEPVAAQVLVGSEQHSFLRQFVPGEGELVGTAAPARLVHTDALGRFTAHGVPLGRVPVTVRAQGCALARQEVVVAADVPAEVEIGLQPEAVVTGRAADEAGAPIEHVAVGLAGAYGLLDPQSSTGPDGVYRLGALPASPIALEARHARLGTDRARFELAAGEERAWDPVLGLGGSLSGRVVDAGGAPLRGWRVEAIGQAREQRSHGGARTDAEGRFTVRGLLDGPHRVTLEAPGTSVPVLQRGNVQPGGPALVLRVPAERQPSAAVRGSVVAEDGRVPVNLALELATANLGMPSEADAAGRFELDGLVPALYVLRVRAQGHVEHVLGPRRLGAGETWDLGRIVLESAGTLTVRARPGASGLEPWFRVHRTSADGSFDLGRLEGDGEAWSFPALAPGRYLLEVAGKGVAAARVPFELAPGEAKTLDVELRPGLPHELRLNAGPDGAALPIAVRLTDEAGVELLEKEPWPFDSSHYRLWVTLVPGRYRLVAETEEGGGVDVELELDEGTVGPVGVELR